MVEQRAKAADNREPEPHAVSRFSPRSSSDLHEFVEDPIAIGGRDSDAAVDDIDTHVRTAAPRAEHDAAAARVAERIGDEIAQDSLEQHGVRIDAPCGWNDTQWCFTV